MSVGQAHLPALGGWHLTLLARAVFNWDERAQLTLIDLSSDAEGEEATAWKPMTDLVVEGHAYVNSSVTTETIASVTFAGRTRSVRATGERRVARFVGGRCEFTRAESFERMPLTWSRAYGGFDAVASRTAGEDLDALAATFADDAKFASAFLYERNAEGVGFIMCENGSANAGTPVPNLDDPEDPVLEGRLAREGPDDWPGAPMPAGFGWVPLHDFPRSLLLGDQVAIPGASALREVTLGALTPHDLERSPRPIASMVDLVPMGLQQDPRGLLGSAPGMATTRLQGGDGLVLSNLEPRCQTRVLSLPKGKPVMRIRPSGCSWYEPTPQLDTVVIRPDQRSVVMVYSAVVRVLSQYPAGELAQCAGEVAWPDMVRP